MKKIRITHICQISVTKMSHPVVSAKYSVVSDKLRCGLRLITVESKCHIIQCLALGMNLCEGTMASSIVFRIQHNPSGRFTDSPTCKFIMQFLLTVPGTIMPCNTFFFERGPESIIRLLQVNDSQARLLEDIDQYNCLYAIAEICTADPTVRQNRATLGCKWLDLGGWSNIQLRVYIMGL